MQRHLGGIAVPARVQKSGGRRLLLLLLLVLQLLLRLDVRDGLVDQVDHARLELEQRVGDCGWRFALGRSGGLGGGGSRFGLQRLSTLGEGIEGEGVRRWYGVCRTGARSGLGFAGEVARCSGQ